MLGGIPASVCDSRCFYQKPHIPGSRLSCASSSAADAGQEQQQAGEEDEEEGEEEGFADKTFISRAEQGDQSGCKSHGVARDSAAARWLSCDLPSTHLRAKQKLLTKRKIHIKKLCNQSGERLAAAITSCLIRSEMPKLKKKM